MKHFFLITTAVMLAVSFGFTQPSVDKHLPFYDVVSEQEITLAKFDSHKAIVLIYTSIHCPYAKLYKERLTNLSNQYADQNVRFVWVNANLNSPSKKETISHMKTEVGTMKNGITYLADQKHLAKNHFKVEKNPEVIILTPTNQGYRKIYQGAIDDNPQSETMVKDKYVETTLNNLLNDKSITTNYQRPVGCRIR